MSASPAPKRSLAIKHIDGEPLTRADIHYDLLYFIFSDPHKVFTDPYGDNPNSRLSFQELYIKALLNSDNLSKAARGHMSKSHLFAEDFAMLTLLVNMGRVNTTMSFFPEKRTSVRTYHPIPALQRTSNSLQDVPRIRHLLKASVIQSDKEGPRLKTPSDILSRAAIRTPPTSVTNLITILCNYSSSIGQAYLEPGIEFTDLFTRKDFSSVSRAKVFLWLCYHYLESPSSASLEGMMSNPFDTDKATGLPPLVPLTEAEINEENVDTEEELLRCREALAKRSTHMAAKSSRITVITPTPAGDEDEPMIHSDESKSKSKRAMEGTKFIPGLPEKKIPADNLRHDLLKTRAERVQHASGTEEDAYNQKPLHVSAPGHYQRVSRSSPYPLAPNARPRSGRLKRSFLETAFHDALCKHPLDDDDDFDYLEARLLILKRLRGEYPEYGQSIEPFIQDYDAAVYLGQS